MRRKSSACNNIYGPLGVGKTAAARLVLEEDKKILCHLLRKRRNL